MYTLTLFSAMSAALFYLGSRAMITSWLWSKYPKPIAKFFDCAACSGFWYGLGLAATAGKHFDLTYLGLPCHDYLTWPIVGLCSIALTPITAGLMQWGLDRVGSAIFDLTEETDGPTQ